MCESNLSEFWSEGSKQLIPWAVLIPFIYNSLLNFRWMKKIGFKTNKLFLYGTDLHKAVRHYNSYTRLNITSVPPETNYWLWKSVFTRAAPKKPIKKAGNPNSSSIRCPSDVYVSKAIYIWRKTGIWRYIWSHLKIESKNTYFRRNQGESW